MRKDLSMCPTMKETPTTRESEMLSIMTGAYYVRDLNACEQVLRAAAAVPPACADGGHDVRKGVTHRPTCHECHT